jgi:hypothetical protein
MSQLTAEQIKYYREHASDNLAPNFLASEIAGLALAYVFVSLRFWARKVSRAKFDKDDWLILIALASIPHVS